MEVVDELGGLHETNPACDDMLDFAKRVVKILVFEDKDKYKMIVKGQPYAPSDVKYEIESDLKQIILTLYPAGFRMRPETYYPYIPEIAKEINEYFTNKN